MQIPSQLADDVSIDRIVATVNDAIYRHVARLDMTAWVTAEPVTFPERMSGEKKSVELGDIWGDRLFDCAWMRFEATLPPGGEADVVVRIDINGELLLVDEDGAPARGLTCIKSTFDPTLGAPGKTVYRVPRTAIKDGVLVLWGDAALNDLFGFVKEKGRVALAEVATVREDVRQLYYDLETLRDYLHTLTAKRPGQAEDSGRSEAANRLREDVLAAAEDWDLQDQASVARARERLGEWFADDETGRPSLTVHAVGQAHLDLAWLWPIRETIRKGARTFASALYNIERYPEYIFGCSQPQLYAWIKQGYPKLYERIKKAVKSGRIEPQGTFWVEPDCNIPAGECFIRQVLHGRRFFQEEFGVSPRYCWVPDVFGYNGQLPQLLKKSGHDYFMTQKLSWNVVNRFGHHSFHWEGIDGTRILTHMLPEETYNSPAAARSLRTISEGYLEREVSGHALMVFGIGDGGGGPDAEHLERMRRAPRLPGMPKLTIEPAVSFFKAWAVDAEKFPVWRGELYLERHQGTLTTQALVKRNNRRAEAALRELEWAAFLASIHAGVEYPAEALDRLWKEILLYQFHDVLPGTSIKRVYDECHARYDKMFEEMAALTRGRYVAVASRRAPGVGPVVFNSLSWPRSEWMNVDGTWRRVRIPALSCAEFRAGETLRVGRLAASPSSLENENLCATFAPDGRLVSLYDKKAGREALAAGQFSNDFVVLPDTGNAWDFEIDHEKKDVWGYLRLTCDRPVLKEAAAQIDGPCASLVQVWTFRSSEIRQTIRLFSESAQLEFATEVTWNEPATMLRVRFAASAQADEARFEIPFGHISRSTHDVTIYQRAQLEVAAHQWVDLSDGRHGLALLNDCKYGFRVKGSVIDMSLIRSVPFPGAPLIAKDDQSTGAEVTPFTDLGKHEFGYALLPHPADFGPAEITRAAREFNIKPTVVVPSPEAGAARWASAEAGSVVVGSPAIEVVAIKRAEAHRGWIIRLVNLTERAVDTPVDLWPGVKEVAECDLIEATVNAIAINEGRGELRFGPFEIKTLRAM